MTYGGLVTRAIAFTIDAALITVVGVIAGAGGALIVDLLRLPRELRTVLVALGGALYLLWSVGYFVIFWSTTGQTLGSRVMRLRVVAADGGTIKPRRAVLRCIGLVLAALPLLAGYALILVDGRRRGLHDRLARTLVVETQTEPVAVRSPLSGDVTSPASAQAPVHHTAFIHDKEHVLWQR
jgi:uncharacterized RDD family membrane protein YckC